jgi:glycosyltransferase involved in cell wall biosynthesis
VPVPPPAYGGIELALDVLARGLARRGHEVQLFTTGDSTCEVNRTWLFDRADGNQIGNNVVELRHAAAAYDVLASCDVVHDHTLAGLFLSQARPDVVVVTTNHGPFDDSLADVYRRASSTVPVIAISSDQARRAPNDLPVAAVIYHGLDLDRYRFDGAGGSYLVALGRMSHDKGIDVAIDVARQAGMPLRIAAKMREPAEREYFEQVIRPRLGGSISYVGEVGHHDKVELLGGARALLNPIRWPEPFGLVMIEALACGTPVIATAQGAVPELVADGVTGFIAGTAKELVAAVGAVDAIDRRWCRGVAEVRFSMDRMARDHEALYRTLGSNRCEPAGGDLLARSAMGFDWQLPALAAEPATHPAPPLI